MAHTHAALFADKAEVTGTEERRTIDVFAAGDGSSTAAPAPAPAPTPAPAPPAARPAKPQAAAADDEGIEEVLSRAQTAATPAPAPAAAALAVPEGEAVSPKQPEPAPAPAASTVDDDSLEVDPLPDEPDVPPQVAPAAAGAAAAVPTTTTVAEVTAATGPTVMRVLATATVRDGPRLSANAIGDLRKGQTVQVLAEEEHDGHVRVRIASATEGTQAWCSRRTAKRALLEVADSATPVPKPFKRKALKKNVLEEAMKGALRGASEAAVGSSLNSEEAMKGALRGASEAVVRNSLDQTVDLPTLAAGASGGGGGGGGGGSGGGAGGEQLEAKMAAAKAAREERKAAAAAKQTFRYRLVEAVRNPSRSLLVGIGSLFAGAVLGPSYIGWRCGELELQSKQACQISKTMASESWTVAAVAAGAGDTMVSAPLLLCFLLSLGYLTSGSDAAAGAAEGAGDGGSSPNAALATMASMGAGGDQRQMQRLLEGGTSVMGMLASLRNLVDDAAGACSAQCSAMCSAQCSAVRSAVQCSSTV